MFRYYQLLQAFRWTIFLSPFHKSNVPATFSERKLHKIGRIDQVIRDYFADHPSLQEISAKDLMKKLVEKGIFLKDFPGSNITVQYPFVAATNLQYVLTKPYLSSPPYSWLRAFNLLYNSVRPDLFKNSPVILLSSSTVSILTECNKSPFGV